MTHAAKCRRCKGTGMAPPHHVCSSCFGTGKTRLPAPSPQRAPAAAAVFGEGKVVVDTGTFQGRPAVFIAPAKMPGDVGASAAREGHDLNSLQPGEFVLTFPTDEHARAVAEAFIASPAPVAAVTVGGLDGPTLASEIWLASNCRDQTGAREGSVLTLVPENGVFEIDARTLLRRFSSIIPAIERIATLQWCMKVCDHAIEHYKGPVAKKIRREIAVEMTRLAADRREA